MYISGCRCCNSENLEVVLDLGDQPWGNDFRSSSEEVPVYPLRLAVCGDCWTPQVDYTVPKHIMYADHTYLSSANKSMVEHFESVANKSVTLVTKERPLVVDIGSNDGTFLKCFHKLDCNTIGVEPSARTAKIALNSGIRTINDFFNDYLVDEIIHNDGRADIVSAANVLYHVEDLHEILSSIPRILSDDGIFVIQGTYWVSLMQNLAFDIIYHEHLLYYYLGNLNKLLNKYGMELFDVDFCEVHGGSFVAYACRQGRRLKTQQLMVAMEKEKELLLNNINTYKDFGMRVAELKTDIISTLTRLKDTGSSICAYGAPVKGTVMLSYCGIDQTLIPHALEVNPLKIDTYIPNTGIKVINENTASDYDYYFVLAWNFINYFREIDKENGKSRRYITPSPKVKIHE